MAGLAAQLRSSLAGRLDLFHQRPFLEAAMAASALVAMADRDVRFSENVALDHILNNVRELKIYDPHRAVDLHRSYVDFLTSDPDGARRKLLELIARYRGDARDADLLVRISLAVGKADSNLSDVEKRVVAEICEVLDVEHEKLMEWASSAS